MVCADTLHSTMSLTDDLANSGAGRPSSQGPGSCRLNVFVALCPRTLVRAVAAQDPLLVPGGDLVIIFRSPGSSDLQLLPSLSI